MKIQSIIYTQTGLGMGFSVILLLFYSCVRCIVTCKLYYASSVLVYTWMVSYNVMLMIYERVCTICKRVLFLFYFVYVVVLRSNGPTNYVDIFLSDRSGSWEEVSSSRPAN